MPQTNDSYIRDLKLFTNIYIEINNAQQNKSASAFIDCDNLQLTQI